MNQPMDLDRIADQPCSWYLCRDAAELDASVSELRAHPESWHYLHEAAIDWDDSTVPYALVVDEMQTTVIFASQRLGDLPEEQMSGLVDAAVQYFLISMSSGGSGSGT